MPNSGKSVLVFLGTCLGFAEAGLGTIAGLVNANGTLLAGFTLVALGMVLATLAFMYKINPGFLTIGGQQASDLAMLQEIARTRPELMTPEILTSLLSREMIFESSPKVDDHAQPNDVEAISALEELIARLQRRYHQEG